MKSAVMGQLERGKPDLISGGTLTHQGLKMIRACFKALPTAFGTSSSKILWTSFTVIWALTCFRAVTLAAQPADAKVAPAYRIDLGAVIKGPFAFVPVGPGNQEPRSGIPIKSLCFIDDQRLAVSVVTHSTGEPSLAAREEADAASPYRLKTMLIQAATGKILGIPDWPSNSRYAWIVAPNDKGFVVETGDELILVSPDLKIMKRLSLPTLPSDEYAHDRFWTPVATWSGKHVALLGWRSWNRGPWMWLDTEDLRILDSWQGVGIGTVAAADDLLVMTTGARRLTDPPPVLVASVPGGNWSALPSTTYPFGPQFVGPDLLYFHRYSTTGPPSSSGVFLMRVNSGDVSRLEPPRKDWGLGGAAVARTGKRFVVLVEQTKGFHPALDIGGHSVLRGFMVFDPPFTTPSFFLEVHGSRIRDPEIPTLSPDGRHLAVMAYPNPVIEIYDLPPAK